MRNRAKKKQGPIDSLSRSWKQANKKNTRKKSRQLGQKEIKDFLKEEKEEFQNGYTKIIY